MILLICVWFVFGFATGLVVLAHDAGSITIGDVFVAVALSPFGFIAMFAFVIPALMRWADTKTIWSRK